MSKPKKGTKPQQKTFDMWVISKMMNEAKNKRYGE